MLIPAKLCKAEKIGIAALLSAVLCFFITPPLALLPLSLFLLLCFLAPFFPGISFFLPVISRAKPGTEGIVLTFDDGPSPEFTPILLDLLARYALPATFFVIGKKAAEHPELIAQILAAGHSIANHSWDHDYFLMLRSTESIQEDLHRTQKVLVRAGVRPLLFRPPVGITGPRLKKVLEQEGLLAVNYSCRALDRGNRQIVGLADKIMRKVRPGDIIMLHDLPTFQKKESALLCTEFDLLFQRLTGKCRVIPMEEALQRPVMQVEKEAGPLGAC
ncbi:MAG: polysaccharide deacetylase family protein [Candidatus Electrothrix scaldis]|nr:MAG: polysaccharide deacetylase family protein [Candidatus Electrothrix sp. GW3-3]